VIVSKLYSRPRRNSSASAGLLGAGVQRPQRRAQLVCVEPIRQVALQPMPAGGLSTMRKPDLGRRTPRRRPRCLITLVARARQAVAAQLVLHARLVAEQVGGVRRRALHTERLAHLGELHLQRLEDAEHAVDACRGAARASRAPAIS
jgi:hypothetical protein